MQLNHQIFDNSASPEAIPLVILPGLFGSISNWRGIAKELSATLPVIVLDQRNHGESPHADSHSYADMVDDLEQFCVAQGLAQIHLAGHSMGGKVAMLFAKAHPQRLASLMILDIAPVRYSHSHAPFLKALQTLDLNTLQSRAEADRALRDAIPDTGTRLFLLQSLSGSPGSYRWRLNIPVLLAYMEEIGGFPDEEFPALDIRTLILAGQESTYLQPQHYAQLKQMFVQARIEEVAGAGHWLHADKPQQVLKLLKDFLVG